jgi:hypothetical protein
MIKQHLRVKAFLGTTPNAQVADIMGKILEALISEAKGEGANDK